MTIVDALTPTLSTARARLAYNASLCLAGSGLIALSAQLSFLLPFSPVPVTGQTFGVLLVAMLLGGTRGALSVLAYLAEGFSGLPVFAGAGGGAWLLLGPTGGYLMGFVPAAYIAGKLAESGWDRHVATTILAMLIGTVTLYAVGLSRLSFFVGRDHALALGMYPFIAGDALKIIGAAVLLPSLRKFVGTHAD
jgi:biotin transport system substrate-specific component